MIKLKKLLTEISKDDFAKSLGRVSQLSSIQARLKARVRDKINYSRARRDRINRGKCVHDENNAHEYSDKTKSLLCTQCIKTRYEPKKSKAILKGICPHCLTYDLYFLNKDKRMSLLCGACHKRERGMNLG